MYHPADVPSTRLNVLPSDLPFGWLAALSAAYFLPSLSTAALSDLASENAAASTIASLPSALLR